MTPGTGLLPCAARTAGVLRSLPRGRKGASGASADSRSKAVPRTCATSVCTGHWPAAHGSSPVPGVIEGCARIATGDRQRALAFRLEFCPDARRWQCTALTLDTDAPTAPGARTGRPSRSTRGGRGPRSRRP
ncbi:Rv3235 family protein [Streptomyces cacaoi]|uniref:Rv3235 family protein n=1 Tax=Streptomyces cacaoi TaxID=1898 RepID=UPI001F23E314|nr:Rv3235 family protein [Streptomyces cacaoi]